MWGGDPWKARGMTRSSCQAGWGEIHFCQWLSSSEDPADSVTKANLVSG